MVLQKTANKQAFWFILPALLAMLFVHIIPIIWGIYISFIDLDVKTLTNWTQAPFVGLENYGNLFTDGLGIGEKFLGSILNIIVYGLITIPVGYIIALSIALVLNENFVGRTLVRGLVLLPYITPDAVMYNVWRFIFQARIGLVNQILMDLSIIEEPLVWLVGDRAMTAVIIASIWKGWPLTCLILLAGLQGIPKELYEAAKIDGANWWSQFRHITLPQLAPVTKTTLLIGSIWTFHAFNQFYVMLGGDTTAKAAVPSLVIHSEAFRALHYGQGAAMAVIVLVVVFVLTSLFLIRRKKDA